MTASVTASQRGSRISALSVVRGLLPTQYRFLRQAGTSQQIHRIRRIYALEQCFCDRVGIGTEARLRPWTLHVKGDTDPGIMPPRRRLGIEMKLQPLGRQIDLR